MYVCVSINMYTLKDLPSDSVPVSLKKRSLKTKGNRSTGRQNSFSLVKKGHTLIHIYEQWSLIIVFCIFSCS